MRVPLGRQVIAVMVIVIVCGAVSCGSGNGQPEPSCPNDIPSSCPSPAPTFTEAAAVIQTRCGGCHAPGGVEAVRPFQTYEQVQPQVPDILFQLNLCLMPPAGQPQPTSSDRQVILGWIKCGATNN